MAALAMAVLIRGLTPAELTRWTHAMINSGERLDLSAVAKPTTDKHSTGGVGDKITLPLAPLVASRGAAGAATLRPRFLGHPGRTLDKLESLPGWRASVSNEEFIAQLNSVGAVVCAAGAGLTPADRKLYALRDVTGTVESIPLIASSIMSKKLAEGSVLARARCEGRHRRLHEDPGERPRTRRDDGGARHRVGRAIPSPLRGPSMSTPLGMTAGHALLGSARVAGGARRRWAIGRRRAHAGLGARDARRSRAHRRRSRRRMP